MRFVKKKINGKRKEGKTGVNKELEKEDVERKNKEGRMLWNREKYREGKKKVKTEDIEKRKCVKCVY